jgi:hypothetical protein
MKVVNACVRDWANFSHENANALRSIGVDCVDVKEHPHQFAYKTESRILSTNNILKQIKEADIVQIMHSDIKMLNLCKSFPNKKIIVYHTGTSYRQNKEKYNALFNPFVDVTITDQCEFMFSPGSNFHYLATAINIDEILPGEINTKAPFNIAHYPSSSEVKGSDRVVDLMTKLYSRNAKKFNFKYTNKMVTHLEQLKRMNECDIYIEMFAPLQNGYPYGCYGVTAFEAAAMGKVVVTQNIYPNVYKKAYGLEHPFIIVGCDRDFNENMEELINKSPEEINAIRENTLTWLHENHSYIPTGNKILSIIANG